MYKRCYAHAKLLLNLHVLLLGRSGFLLSLDLKVPAAGGFYNPAKTSIPSKGSGNTPRCFMLLKLGQAVAAQIFLARACVKLSCIFFFRCLSYF